MRRVVTMLVALGCLSGCGDDEETNDTKDAGATRDGSVAQDAATADAGTPDTGVRDAAADTGAAGDGGASDGGAGDGGVVTAAHAALAPKSVATTQSTTMGTGAFTKGGTSVSFVLSVTGAPPGQHGVHIHEKGDCSSDDGASAGGHWNPTMHMHGGLTDPSTTHLGDLGNLTVAADGSASMTVMNTGWTLGDGAASDVVGKAVVVHLNVDDLTTQANADAGVTPGNSGGRIACGVIVAGP